MQWWPQNRCATTGQRFDNEATMPGARAFAGQESLPFWLQPSLADDKEGIVDAVRRGVVGDYEPFMSPFGERRVVYSDWSASGR